MNPLLTIFALILVIKQTLTQQLSVPFQHQYQDQQKKNNNNRLLSSSGIQQFYLPCNDQVEQNYRSNFTFYPDFNNFIIEDTLCQNLALQSKFSVELNLVQSTQFINDTCYTEKIILLLTNDNCKGRFSFTINSLFIDSDNNTQINQEKVRLTPNDIIFAGLLNFEMNHIILEKFNKTINFVQMGKVQLNNCISQNTRIFSNSQYFLAYVQQLLVLNSEFYNQQCDFKASCSFKANFIGYAEFNECIFKGNKANWLGAAMWLGFTQVARIKNSLFLENFSSYHGGNLFIYRIDDYLAENVTIANNTSQFYGGGYFIQRGGNLVMKDCKFLGNKAGERGGCILTYSNPQYLELINCTFEENEAVEGGALYLGYSVVVKVLQSTFIKNQAIGNGGAILQGISPHIEVHDCIFEENVSVQGKGGAVGLENVYVPSQGLPFTFILKNNTYIKNKAVDGGALSVQSIPIIVSETTVIEDQRFIQNEAYQGSGGALLLGSLKNEFQIKNIQFLNNVAKVSGGGLMGSNIQNTIFQDIFFQQNKASHGAAMEISLNSENISFKEIEIDKNQATSHGGGAKLISAKNITYENVNITDNTCVSFGGAFYSSKCQQIYIINTRLTNNRAQVGGAQYLHESSDIYYHKVWVQQNSAQNFAGAFRGIQTRNVEIIDSYFENNQAVLEVGALFFQLSNNTYIKNTEFLNNSAQGSKGCLQIAMQQNLTIENSRFMNNIGNDISGALYVFSSQDIQFHNITVQNNTNNGKQGGGITLTKLINFQIQNSDIQFNLADEQAGGMQLSESQGVHIFKTIISNNKAKLKGGGMIITESKDLVMENVEINNNQVQQNGGGILMANVQSLQMKKTEINSNNCTIGIGGGITIIQDSDNIILQDLEILNNYAFLEGGGIYIKDSQKIEVQKMEIYENIALQNAPGIYSQNLKELDLQNVKFKNHQGKQNGGAIYSQDLNQLSINNCIFQENYASEKGGAIYSQNIEKFSIGNSTFDKNYIKYTQEQQQDQQDDDFDQKNAIKSYGGTISIQNCKELNIQQSEILNSYASMQGGGVYIQDGVKLNISDSKFSNNTVQFSQEMDLQQKDSEYILSQGGSIYFQPMDQNENEQYITIQNVQIENCQASSGGAILVNKNSEQQLKITIKNSTFLNNSADLGPNIRFLGYEKDTSLVNLEGLESQHAKQILFQKEEFDEKTSLGNYFGYFYNEKRVSQQHSQFQLCLQGQYIQQGGAFICSQCIENGICEGGYKPVLPMEKYWRDSVYSYEFIYCSNNPEVCLGRDQCKEGHIGILCEQCDRVNDYSLSKMKLECELCDTNKTLIVLEMVLIFIVIVLFIFNQIYGVTMKINKQIFYKYVNMMLDLPFYKINQLSASTKILVLHFQILYVSVNSQVEQFQEFVQNLQFIGNPQTGFARNMECLIEVEQNEDVKMIEYYISFYGLLVLVGTVILVIFCEILCLVFKKYIKTRQYLIQVLQCTLIIFLLFIQPAMVQNSLEYLKIRTINNIDYCYANTYITIDSDIYQNELKPYNIAIVILLGLIFPIVLCTILYKGIKKKLYKQLDFQRKLGILYLEYKNSTIYWEIVVIFLKISCVVVSSLLQDYLSVKGIFIVFILIGYLFLCLKIWPYMTRLLNIQAIGSSLVLILTIGGVTNFFKQDMDDSSKTFINVLIILLNMVFLAYSGVIMVLDFKIAFRQLASQYMVCLPKQQQQIKEKSRNKLRAIYRWRILKRCIVQTAKIVKQDKNLDDFPIIFYQNYLKQQIFQEHGLNDNGDKISKEKAIEAYKQISSNSSLDINNSQFLLKLQNIQNQNQNNNSNMADKIIKQLVQDKLRQQLENQFTEESVNQEGNTHDNQDGIINFSYNNNTTNIMDHTTMNNFNGGPQNNNMSSYYQQSIHNATNNNTIQNNNNNNSKYHKYLMDDTSNSLNNSIANNSMQGLNINSHKNSFSQFQQQKQQKQGQEELEDAEQIEVELQQYQQNIENQDDNNQDNNILNVSIDNNNNNTINNSNRLNHDSLEQLSIITSAQRLHQQSQQFPTNLGDFNDEIVFM